jgi:undecaprenyl phosphate N,N'-diacetylbacillosamine 1-phosphate transferase
MYTSVFKRVIDFVIALIILILLSPIIIGVILLLVMYNKGEVFFVQKRPGKNEDIFGLIKFKTMRDLFDFGGNPLPDKDRITPIGKFIRKTSMDELPQLINVLKGDMSLVGPRPLLIKYLPLYSDFQKRRHEVKPGITGWAQVNGRNAISWQKKFELDVYYVDHLSFVLDMQILFRTFIKVFKASDINGLEATTMKPFTGNN